jgi:hypothetical protein
MLTEFLLKMTRINDLRCPFLDLRIPAGIMMREEKLWMYIELQVLYIQ